MRIREEAFSGTVFDHFADKGAVSRRLIEEFFFLISWALSFCCSSGLRVFRD